MTYNIQKLINILLEQNGYLEKRKSCPRKNLYEKIGSYVGSDNYTMFWQDAADWGLPNYQGSYYCIATLFWGMAKAFGLAAAQELCLQKFMLNCQVTYNLFKAKGQVFNTPKIGDIILFWNGSRMHHAELVIDVKGDSFKTFGANTAANSAIRNGGGCYAPKNYSIKACQAAGHKFCRPDYGTQTDKWVSVNNKWKYQLADRSFVNNQWKYIKDRWYVFDGDGYMVTGWYLNSNGQWYYLCGDGGMAQGWQMVNDKWYFLDGSGDMYIGWLQDGDKWYYLNEDGSMVSSSWKQIDGNHYVFDQCGKMLSNTWFHDSTEKWYYLSSTGSMKTSEWIQHENGKWYYLTNDGSMAKSAYVKDKYKDMYYWVDDSGVYIPSKDTNVISNKGILIE